MEDWTPNKMDLENDFGPYVGEWGTTLTNDEVQLIQGDYEYQEVGEQGFIVDPDREQVAPVQVYNGNELLEEGDVDSEVVVMRFEDILSYDETELFYDVNINDDEITKRHPDTSESYDWNEVNRDLGF